MRDLWLQHPGLHREDVHLPDRAQCYLCLHELQEKGILRNLPSGHADPEEAVLKMEKERSTVQIIREGNLCISCGLCRGVCPADCISLQREKGLYRPVVDTGKCVSCGLCLKVCPGKGHVYGEGKEDLKALDAVLGETIACFTAWSRNESERFCSASGGVVTSLVKALLDKGIYDAAFLVNSYIYSDQLRTAKITAGDLNSQRALSRYPKSRYFPVSHENAVKDLLRNRKQRTIIIGTSCAVRGFRSLIREAGLDEGRILLIGLFCDKVFNYNAWQYYERADFHKGRKVEAFHFKNKECGGWPGNMKFFYKNGESSCIDMKERTKIKDFFMPERCMYCIDKLNSQADIALGDNYTNQDSSPLGSNSVIIRTETGLRAWTEGGSGIEYRKADLQDLVAAQYLDGRINNLYFGDLKEKEIRRTYREEFRLNEGIRREEGFTDFQRAWKIFLEKVRAGEDYPASAGKLEKLMRTQGKESILRKAAKKVKRVIFH